MILKDVTEWNRPAGMCTGTLTSLQVSIFKCLKCLSEPVLPFIPQHQILTQSENICTSSIFLNVSCPVIVNSVGEMAESELIVAEPWDCSRSRNSLHHLCFYLACLCMIYRRAALPKKWDVSLNWRVQHLLRNNCKRSYLILNTVKRYLFFWL